VFTTVCLFRTESVHAAASYQPTGGLLVVGAEATRTSGATSGNVGGWQGTLAQDATAPGFNWTVTANIVTGLDQQIQVDNVSLNGANKFTILMRAAASLATLNRAYQICDWVTTTNVDTAADANCTGGGWRTLNIRKVNITTTAITNYTWQIYDGYWTTSTTGNTSISTPLSNFIKTDSTKRVLLRAFSTSAVGGTHTLDWVSFTADIDPIYHAAGFTQITGGAVATSYINTENGTLTGQSGSDATYLSIPGTAGAISDSYLSYKNVKTYTGMNTIMVNSRYSCSATGINIKPKIYNFNSAAWEDLVGTAIACSATDATNEFAKNNVTITNYISGGEIRIGWYGSANNVLSIRIDFQYIIVGSTNSNTALCEISFGTGTATNCSNTRDLDSTLATPSTWQPTTELESAAFGHAYYGGDNDGDATNAEAAASVNLSFPVTPASNASIVSLGYAMRWRSNSATITTQGGFKDYQGDNTTIAGGWTAFGTTNVATTYTFEDMITNGYFQTSPSDYFDTNNDLMNVRVRTSAGTATVNVTQDVDFVMATISWTQEPSSIPDIQANYTPTGGNLAVGAENTRTSGATSGNVGGWQGTLAQDATSPGFNWTVTSNAVNGLDQQIRIDNVQLNGANKFEIVMRAAASAATLNRLYQICDWTSTTNVDNAADANCTGGGWRTLNILKANITTAAITNYTWHIYDGYWTTTTTSNTSVSTPLSNFIKTDSTKRVLLRAFSTSAVTVTHTLDWIKLSVRVDPVYFAGGFTQITGGAVATSYINTNNGTLTGQSASDNNRISVPGTAGAISDFYFSYKNVKTYTGMNSIVVVSEYGCSATGINLKPKIFNFNSSAWEDLTATTIACAAADTTSQFVKNNVTIGNYISSGEIRVEWYGSANNVLSLRVDSQYIIVGTTNTDSALCEISFGTGTATNCTNSRDFDSTAAASTWQNPTEVESATFGHVFYGSDNDGDATNAEAAGSVNLSFTVTQPENSTVANLGYALDWRSNSATITTQGGFKDLQGDNATIAGGWTNFGTTNTLTTFSYEDVITNSYFTNDPNDYLDQVNDRVNMKIHNTAGTATVNVTQAVDFAFVTISWVEGPAPIQEQAVYRIFTNADSTDVGSALAAQNTAATLTTTSQAFRVRLLDHATVAQVPINSLYKLQFVGKGTGTCAAPSGGTPASYTDVTAATTIAYKNNATPADGTALTANASDPTNGTFTIDNQTYEELNNFSNTQSAIPETEDGKWDLALVDNGSQGNIAYCFRIVKSDGTVIDTYTNYPQITTANTAPNAATALAQKKTDDTVIATGGWINQTSVKFTVTATDPDAADTLSLCVEKKPIASSFVNTEDLCGTAVAYSGSSITVTVTITSIADATEYHWQARVKDTAGLFSGWVSYDVNAESARDFGIDTTAPTTLTVYDGTVAATDAVFNSGTLSSLSANWDTLNANVSGLLSYDYSIGTTAGGTDILAYTTNGTTTSVTASGLTLQSSIMYFINVRVNDYAGNNAVFSSNGQRVLPTLSFSLSSGSVTFAHLNNGNSFTDTQTTTLTTSTNAFNGYVIRLFKADSLRSTVYPAVTISDFAGGSYASPAGWTSGTGFGYTSSDTTIQGVNKFQPASCAGGGTAPCYAPFSSTAPGDIVADHTSTVSGSPVSNETFTMTYKVATPVTQPAGPYSTTLVYTIIPQY
jgi:hypothetical protein